MLGTQTQVSADIFSKTIKVSLSPQEGSWHCLVPVVKSELSSKSQNFGKLVSASMMAS